MISYEKVNSGFIERNAMLKLLFSYLLLLCIVGIIHTQVQRRSVTLIRFILDESILIVTEKPVYFPVDIHHLAIQREDSTITASVAPIV